MTDTAANARPIPPYSSFTTVLNLIERMATEGVPRRVDKTYLVGMAGGTQNQVLASLRSLGLTNDQNYAEPILSNLAKQPDLRQGLWAQILAERFPDLLNIATQNSTPGELNEALAAYGLTGATQRKAASFLVAAASYAGFDVSPHLRPARPAGATGPTRRSRPVRRRQPPNVMVDQPINGRPGSAEEMRRSYFDLLIEKAKSDSGDTSDLLNRIERLIGVPPADPSSESGADAGSKPADHPAS